MSYNERPSWQLCLTIHRGTYYYSIPLLAANAFLICIVIVHYSRYESKRVEIETWLHRMESRAERMGTIAITADILDAQQKEQKVSELWLKWAWHPPT